MAVFLLAHSNREIRLMVLNTGELSEHHLTIKMPYQNDVIAQKAGLIAERSGGN